VLELDGLRAFAIIPVIFSHCYPVEGGDSDDVDQSFRSHADQIGAKRRRTLSV
jgi:peptidoglycan/LPS O-acetylase OafA/YrhL